jgi:LAGLIDADG DNA endonuclease family
LKKVIIKNFLMYFSISHLYNIKNLLKEQFSKESDNFEFEYISPELKEIIVGLGLGDLDIQINEHDTCFCFTHSFKNKDYLYHLYSLFYNYCFMKPAIYKQLINGRLYECIAFCTLRLTVFNYYHNMFCIDNRKIIPLNIGDNLTARGLAY